jgi:hypothetical protein
MQRRWLCLPPFLDIHAFGRGRRPPPGCWAGTSGARLTATAAAAASSSSMPDSSVARAASVAALSVSCALVADASSGVGRWGFLTGGAAHDDDDVDMDNPDEVVLSAATGARDEPCGTRLTAFGGGGGEGAPSP